MWVYIQKAISHEARFSLLLYPLVFVEEFQRIFFQIAMKLAEIEFVIFPVNLLAERPESDVYFLIFDVDVLMEIKDIFNTNHHGWY